MERNHTAGFVISHIECGNWLFWRFFDYNRQKWIIYQITIIILSLTYKFQFCKIYKHPNNALSSANNLFFTSLIYFVSLDYYDFSRRPKSTQRLPKFGGKINKRQTPIHLEEVPQVKRHWSETDTDTAPDPTFTLRPPRQLNIYAWARDQHLIIRDSKELGNCTILKNEANIFTRSFRQMEYERSSWGFCWKKGDAWCLMPGGFHLQFVLISMFALSLRWSCLLCDSADQNISNLNTKHIFQTISGRV